MIYPLKESNTRKIRCYLSMRGTSISVNGEFVKSVDLDETGMLIIVTGRGKKIVTNSKNCIFVVEEKKEDDSEEVYNVDSSDVTKSIVNSDKINRVAKKKKKRANK